MPEETLTKDDLLAQLDAMQATLDDLMASAGPVHSLRPGAAGDWSFRDVVAHLNGWRERTV